MQRKALYLLRVIAMFNFSIADGGYVKFYVQRPALFVKFLCFCTAFVAAAFIVPYFIFPYCLSHDSEEIRGRGAKAARV